ncbi:hypothetical protein [Streptomyces sp. NRRL WC-3549]|uniref:hypothetical protein n=1 Tax=Streptomyces sp. NRRL WC-3549 TaxID=1463925 RepID=UPI0004C9A93E|nr:hypothetical protein [Streptomyces sp. NRRL WC-3549]
MVHVTEDLVDDALDRAGDFERGMRHSLSDALDDDRHHRDRHRHDRDHHDRGCHDGGHHGQDRHDDDCDDDDRDRRPRIAAGARAGSSSRDADELVALTAQISLLADRLERHRDEGRGRATTGAVPPPRDAEDYDALREDLATLSARIDRLSAVER